MYKIGQRVYQISCSNLVEEMYIVGIYTLERVKSDKQYAFNAPSQLVALRSDKGYDGAICEHEFKNPNAIGYGKIYTDIEQAIETANNMIMYQKAKEEKEQKILSLRMQIEELENS